MLAVVLTVVVVGGVVGGLPLFAARARRGGGGASVMGPFEEMWHPAARRARVEVEVAEERRVPTPSPDGPAGLRSVRWSAPAFRARRGRR
ncbi:MAG TPA: hypothetical protein VGH76_01285 [Actinomycetospora sp.]|uniref:hypothetical protein n=1 Tax=Actinomycetospora sp. TaxID=1872135 RepID=UPI002F3F61F6